LSILLIVVLVLAIVVFGRLVWVQVIDAYAIEHAEGSQRTVTVDVEPRRGTIYDRNGVVLATTVDAYNLFCHPHKIQDTGQVSALVEGLVQACGGDANEYREKIEQNTNFVYLVKGVDEEQLNKVKELQIDGFDYEKTSKRIYPCGAIASQLIGVVNSEGEPISGLELYYNDILGGTPGKKTTMYSKEGVPVPGATQIEAEVVNGQDIVVSIDVELQEQVEKAVLKRTEEVDGKTGFGAVMNAETGEMLACASVPTFDVTDLSEVEEGATNLSGISGHYEPGSVFKAVTMLAALEEGTVSVDKSYYCPSILQVGEHKITDSHEREDKDMTATTIMADSSNIGMSLIARDLTFSKFYEYLQKYQIVSDTNIDYPGAASGYLAPRDKWTEVQGYNISFGQGLEVSPIQMMRFYGLVASNGTIVQPHFLLDVPSSDEELVYSTEKVVDNDQAIDDLDTMLEAVVKDGTGTQAAIDGYRVAGKTGTAEIASPNGGYKEGVYNISFVGYLPDASTKLVCFVGATDVPGERKTVPAFHEIMEFAIDRYHITQN
jgi:cell division protein FtsI (penicillin-binding protein 3)